MSEPNANGTFTHWSDCNSTSMVIVAFDTGQPLIAAGATVFAASDSILAVDRFVEPRPWAPLAVMITYHVGQALIVAGVLAAA